MCIFLYFFFLVEPSNAATYERIHELTSLRINPSVKLTTCTPILHFESQAVMNSLEPIHGSPKLRMSVLDDLLTHCFFPSPRLLVL